MKANIHPQDYRLVVFQDLNNDTSFLIKSSARTKETVKHTDGQTYPLVKLHITSASHPFYTGLEKVIDIEGRIDKFKSRQQAAEEAQKTLQAKSLKALKKTTEQAADKQKSKPAAKAKSAPRTKKAKAVEPAAAQDASGDDKA